MQHRSFFILAFFVFPSWVLAMRHDAVTSIHPASEVVVKVMTTSFDMDAKQLSYVHYLNPIDFYEKFENDKNHLINDYHVIGGPSGMQSVWINNMKRGELTIDFAKKHWLSRKIIDQKIFSFGTKIIESRGTIGITLKEFRESKSSLDVLWYFYDGITYINAINEKELLEQELFPFQAELESKKKELVDFFSKEAPLLQQNFQEINVINESYGPDDALDFEQLTDKYSKIQKNVERAYHYTKKLPETVDDVRRLGTLVNQVSQRIDELTE